MLLELHNWRCFESNTFNLPVQGLSICDQNGAGKTSVLSAIYTLYTASPWVDLNLKNCIKHHQFYFGLKNEELSFNAKLESSGRMKTKFEILSDNFQKPLILNYSPLDNQLFYLTRSKKLGFIDQILGQLLPNYLLNLKTLNKLLAHKQAIIKQVMENQELLDNTLLHTINQSIFNFSIYFWIERAKFLDYLNQEISSIEPWLNLSFGKFQIKYFTTIDSLDRSFIDFRNMIERLEGIKEIQEKNDLKLYWGRELAAGRCLFGAQRDDFDIWIEDSNITEVLSRGQMRMLVLWLKYLSIGYAQYKLDVRCKTWWLLDDVFNELDSQREKVLAEYMLNKIDWFLITTTRPTEICTSYSLSDLSK